MNPFAANAACIEAEIGWFRNLLDLRLKIHAGEQGLGDPLRSIEPPRLPEGSVPYAEVVRRFSLGSAERLVLILSYLPHIQPDALDPFFIQNRALERRFTEFGGWVGRSHSGFLPTVGTALFLLAGEDLQARLAYHTLFQPDHDFYRQQVLRLDPQSGDEPSPSAALILTAEYVEKLATGRSYEPTLSAEFPAERITTPLSWHDLVLERPAREDVEDIVAWVQHEGTLMEDWRLKKRLKPGYRSLFYGPPGTGKTLTACLLGQATSTPVYRVDTSKVVSKYIGETEKNLARLFDTARCQRWILFFDEADSLFGKRTESRSSNDRAANQQISYLLQRIEAFPGIVLLASNLRSHIDPAFARRFQSMIHFAMPSAELRLRLWRRHFEHKPYRLSDDVDLRQLARDHELSGGSIVNVLRFACLKAVVREPPEIRARDLIQGIRRELHKEGKYLG